MDALIVMTFLTLLLLQVKHWYVDFVNQSEEEVKHKGIYLDWLGVKHSLKQGLGTAFVFWIWCGPLVAVLLGLIDFVLHYHIDYVKMHYGNRDITTPQFWNQLGLDQMAHQITYLLLTFMVVF